LLLVILIENAFKFVSSFADKENRIVIKLTAANGGFDFFVSNTTEYRQSMPSLITQGGIGLTNLKRRLELLYPGKYAIDFKQDADQYEASLKLTLA